MDAVCALDACVMVKADNESVGRDIRERELSDRAVKRDRLSVADAPIVRALSRVGNGLDNAPLVIVERRAHERERQRVGGRAGNDIDGAARRLPVLVAVTVYAPVSVTVKTAVPLLVFVAIVVPPFFSVTDAPESTLTVIVAEKNVSATA